jgi:hypothetical protein
MIITIKREWLEKNKKTLVDDENEDFYHVNLDEWFEENYENEIDTEDILPFDNNKGAIVVGQWKDKDSNVIVTYDFDLSYENIIEIIKGIEDDDRVRKLFVQLLQKTQDDEE